MGASSSIWFRILREKAMILKSVGAAGITTFGPYVIYDFQSCVVPKKQIIIADLQPLYNKNKIMFCMALGSNNFHLQEGMSYPHQQQSQNILSIADRLRTYGLTNCLFILSIALHAYHLLKRIHDIVLYVFVLEVNIMPTAIKRPTPELLSGKHWKSSCQSGRGWCNGHTGTININGVLFMEQNWLVVVKVGILFLINSQSSLQE